MPPWSRGHELGNTLSTRNRGLTPADGPGGRASFGETAGLRPPLARVVARRLEKQRAYARRSPGWSRVVWRNSGLTPAARPGGRASFGETAGLRPPMARVVARRLEKQRAYARRSP